MLKKWYKKLVIGGVWVLILTVFGEALVANIRNAALFGVGLILLGFALIFVVLNIITLGKVEWNKTTAKLMKLHRLAIGTIALSFIVGVFSSSPAPRIFVAFLNLMTVMITAWIIRVLRLEV